MLAVATGWTLEYIDSMPMYEFNNMMALNYIDPYTHDVTSRRDGLLITETFNSRRKKQASISDLFPYMANKTPDWLIDKAVLTARNLIERHESGCKLRKETPTYDFIRPKIEEEIEIEKSSSDPDKNKIKQLQKLLGNITNGR